MRRLSRARGNTAQFAQTLLSCQEDSNTKSHGSLPTLVLSRRWTVVTPMSSNRSAAGVTVFEGRIYVSGGHDGLQIFNSVSMNSSWAKSTYSFHL